MEGRFVQLRIEDGRLVVLPVDDKPAYTLDELLAGMNPDDRRVGAFDGSPAGPELF